MSEVVAAQLEARLAQVAGEVRASLDAWVAGQRRLVAQLTRRLGALSGELAVAERRFREALGSASPRTREEAWRAFQWLSEFDRERQRVEHEVWALIRRARKDEADFSSELGRRSRTLLAIPTGVADAMATALAEAGQGEGRVADGEHGQELARSQRARLEAARAAAEQLLARGEAQLKSALERGAPDWQRVNERFEAVVAERFLGGEMPRPVTAPRAPPKRAAAPPRKRAKVPKFLINAFYKKGNLRTVGGDTEITFVNPLAFCIVQNGDPILVDGRPHPAESTLLDNGHKRIVGTSLSDANYLKYPKGCALKVTLTGCRLTPGPHRINMSLELRKMGWIDLNVTDEAL